MIPKYGKLIISESSKIIIRSKEFIMRMKQIFILVCALVFTSMMFGQAPTTLFENFDDDTSLPTGWTSGTFGNTVVNIVANIGVGGSNAVAMGIHTNAANWVQTPLLTITDGSVLSFSV